MPKPKTFLISFGLLAAAALLFGYRHWRSGDAATGRADLLSLMPADSSAVAFLDLQALRNSPFLAQILSLAPVPAPDRDYQQFVQAIGFNYERDLDSLAISLNQQSQTPTAFAVAEGRFDRKKIETYASQFGSLKTAHGKTLFAVPVTGSNRKAYFTFLRDNRVALANDSSYFFQHPASRTVSDWREHFSRVAGTPVFVVLREDSVSGAMLAQAPGGFRSPQLATLLSQLQWITISGKPEGDFLRVVIDGDTLMANTMHQLKDVLSGLVVIAQVGLNDAKTRSQLAPDLRQGYLDLLQSADIQEVDRGTSKSVRVMFEVAPALLQAAHNAPATSTAEPQPESKANPANTPARDKSKSK